jgi:Holliday junction resolvasome RuvABC endonuclease subunit
MAVIPRVMGIDPSISATGLCLPDGMLQVVGGDAALGDLRLAAIFEAVDLVCEQYEPDLAVIEDLPTHAHGAGITGMVQGVVRLALMRHSVPYAKVVPSTLKKYATGDGRADKSDLRMALYQRAAIDERNDNKVDAWWLRHMGLDRFGCAPIDLPIAQRASLKVPVWPEVAA